MTDVEQGANAPVMPPAKSSPMYTPHTPKGAGVFWKDIGPVTQDEAEMLHSLPENMCLADVLAALEFYRLM